MEVMALTIFCARLSGMEASSAASFIAVSLIPKPTDTPPDTILSHLSGHVCFVPEIVNNVSHAFLRIEHSSYLIYVVAKYITL